MKIPKNSAQAYVTGVAEGRKQGCDTGFQAGIGLSLIGYYNANAELDFLTDEQIAKLSDLAEREINRLLRDVYVDDDPETMSLRILYHTDEIRKKMKMKEL